MIACARMTEASLQEAFGLLSTFLSEDEHYLDSSSAYGHGGDEGLRAALEQFLARPELGFVWLAHDGSTSVGVCVVSFAISTSAGGLVAKLDDVFVRPGRRGEGIGSALLDRLKTELGALGVRRIDTSVHLQNPRSRVFYTRLGFVALNEERLACMIPNSAPRGGQGRTARDGAA